MERKLSFEQFVLVFSRPSKYSLSVHNRPSIVTDLLHIRKICHINEVMHIYKYIYI